MIRILIDSSSDYLPKAAARKGIQVHPLLLHVDDVDYRDGVDFRRDQFYERLEESDDFPTTSQASVETFLTYFEEARDAGDELIAIILSSKLSGTYANALTAQEELGYDGIYVIDAYTATYPICYLADEAARLRDAGCDAFSIVAAIEAMKPKVKIIGVLSTLEYLHRGGRIPKAAATIGDLARLRPVITVFDGAVGVAGVCLGRKKTFDFIVNQLKRSKIDRTRPIYSLYTYGTSNTERLEKALSLAGIEVDGRRQVGAILGSHLGPGGYGVTYVEE